MDVVADLNIPLKITLHIVAFGAAVAIATTVGTTFVGCDLIQRMSEIVGKVGWPEKLGRMECHGLKISGPYFIHKYWIPWKKEAVYLLTET